LILFYTLEILDCSSPDINIKKLEDDRCKEPNRRHSLSSEVKRMDRMVSTLDEHVYDELIDREGTKTKSQRSCLDSLQSRNSNSTIPVSQRRPFSYGNVPNMDKRNPDHVDRTAIEFAFRRNTDVVPSTKKTERRGGMVGVVKPSGHKVKLQEVVQDIKSVKPVNSSSDIDSLSIRDLGEYLHILKIGQYAERLADAQIDGILLKELDEQILNDEFGFKWFEAIKLMKFARHGHLPKP
jgi:hypothetical protein